MSGTLVGKLTARSATRPELFMGPLVSPLRADRAAGLTSGTNAAAWATLLGDYDLSESPEGPVDPWEVPGIYEDPTGHAAAVNPLRFDAQRAFNFAVRWQLTGNEAAADAAAAQIAPWTTVGTFSTSGNDTPLTWSYTFPILLGAASLIRDSAAYATIADALDDVTRRSRSMSTAYNHENNWADWGVAFELASAAQLGDRLRFNFALARWADLLERHTESDGSLTLEKYREGGDQGDGRSGLLYSSFTLLAKVIGAEIARSNGVWIYDTVTPSGRSLRQIWEATLPWLVDPDTYPFNSGPEPTAAPFSQQTGHYEVLHALWPNEDSATIVAAARPTGLWYGSAYTSVTHAGIDPAA